MSALELEGYALSNMVRRAELVPCKGGKSRVVAVLSNGEPVETPCLEDGAARNVYLVVALYKKWSPLVVRSGPQP